MLSFQSLIGLVAAFCTTASYVPQVRKCWQTKSTGDLSLKMILLLASGIALWIVYGVLRRDLVIIGANALSLLFLSFLLFFKVHEIWRGGQAKPAE
jgi:MtN3 and saliva related transmembrane protein